MHRRAAALAALVTAGIACNDYQFSPVSHCVLQPGSVRVTLDDTSAADILFVVDDSPSTNEKQAGLAASFKDFVQRMVETNVARANKGIVPIDFHVAVTTSSVLSATPASTWCVTGAGCCQASACTNVSSCTRGTGGGCGTGQVCIDRPVLDSSGQYLLRSQPQCCTASACAPSAGCSAGDACPVTQTTYPNPFPSSSFCTPGLATAGAPYPAGSLVAAPSNPLVLDFPKSLGWASWGTASPDPALTQLVSQFQQNIRVGSCGSGEEQHLEAARLALEKAAAGRQGVSWPHPGAKLIVVWVGDEDDCSSPAGAPLVMSTFAVGADSCVLDKHRPAGDQREFPLSAYADFFEGLAHPGGASSFAAAFVTSSVRCADGSYAPADVCSGTPSCPVSAPASCNPPAPVCGGAYAAGERFLALADQLRGRGVQVVEGSVCDAYPPSSFGPLLSRIADLAAPPSRVELPTVPAARAVTVLTIADGSGRTRKICRDGSDWCFVDCADDSRTPACLGEGTSRCMAIDHVNGQCEANPGESYSAEYLGFVPPGGCQTTADCDAALGSPGTWTCTKDPGAARGTCTCR